MFLYSRVDSTLGCGEHTIYALTAHRVGRGFQVTVTGSDARVPVRGCRFGRAGSSLQITGLNARVPVTSYRFGRVGSSSQERLQVWARVPVYSYRLQVWALRFQLEVTGFGARVPVTSYRSGRVGSS